MRATNGKVHDAAGDIKKERNEVGVVDSVVGRESGASRTNG
jgi:hypothetical protein